MAHMVQCIKLKKEAEGLERAPFPNALGQRIYDHVSKEAWDGWIRYQTMLINENRLSMIDPQARQFLMQQLDAYFFAE